MDVMKTSHAKILQFLFLIPLEKCDGRPLQYSCLKNPMGGGAWWAAAVHGVAKSRTQLSDFTFTFHFPALDQALGRYTLRHHNNPVNCQPLVTEEEIECREIK